MKYTLVRLSTRKAWHIARTDKHTVCGKRIYTTDWYGRDQTPTDGDTVCRECDRLKDDEPAMLAGVGYSF